MMDQEKRRMELEVARMLLNKQKTDKLIAELTFQLERRRRKREKKARRVSRHGYVNLLYLGVVLSNQYYCRRFM